MGDPMIPAMIPEWLKQEKTRFTPLENLFSDGFYKLLNTLSDFTHYSGLFLMSSGVFSSDG
jgi:hypothetical protein